MSEKPKLPSAIKATPIKPTFEKKTREKEKNPPDDSLENQEAISECFHDRCQMEAMNRRPWF